MLIYHSDVSDLAAAALAGTAVAAAGTGERPASALAGIVAVGQGESRTAAVAAAGFAVAASSYSKLIYGKN